MAGSHESSTPSHVTTYVSGSTCKTYKGGSKFRTRTVLGSYGRTMPKSIGTHWGRCLSLFTSHPCAWRQQTATPRASRGPPASRDKRLRGQSTRKWDARPGATTGYEASLGGGSILVVTPRTPRGPPARLTWWRQTARLELSYTKVYEP